MCVFLGLLYALQTILIIMLPSVCSLETVQQWSYSLASESVLLKKVDLCMFKQHVWCVWSVSLMTVCLSSRYNSLFGGWNLQHGLSSTMFQEKANQCWLGNICIYSLLVGKCFSQSKNCLPNSITSVLNLQSAYFKEIWLYKVLGTVYLCLSVCTCK